MKDYNYLNRYLAYGIDDFVEKCSEWLSENNPEDASRRDAYMAGAVAFAKLTEDYWHEYANEQSKKEFERLNNEICSLRDSERREGSRFSKASDKLYLCINFIEEVLEKESPVKNTEVRGL